MLLLLALALTSRMTVVRLPASNTPSSSRKRTKNRFWMSRCSQRKHPIVGRRQLLRDFATHAVFNQPAEHQVGVSHRFWRVHLVDEGVMRRVAAIALCADGQQHDPSD